LQTGDKMLIELSRDHDVTAVCQSARTVADGRKTTRFVEQRAIRALSVVTT